MLVKTRDPKDFNFDNIKNMIMAESKPGKYVVLIYPNNSVSLYSDCMNTDLAPTAIAV